MYVFEGKPPELKIEQLKQRREKRDEADKELAAAKESGDQAAIEKYSKRTTKVWCRAGCLWGRYSQPCRAVGSAHHVSATVVVQQQQQPKQNFRPILAGERLLCASQETPRVMASS